MISTEERRASKLNVIKGLLDKANNNPYGEEAAACREKAEQLMVAYRISEWEIQKSDKARTDPTMRLITVVREDGNVVKPYLIDLFVILCKFAHCQAIYTGLLGDGQCTAQVVGYPEDIEYLDILYTNVSLQFSNELNPHVDTNLSRGENIYRMKAAGLAWLEIFTRLDVPFYDEYGKKSRFHSVLMGEYTRFYSAHNLKPISANPKTWVRNFSEGYVRTIQDRIFTIIAQQRVARENEDAKVGEKYALVLRDRDQMVKDKFKELYPTIHYVKSSKKVGTHLGDARAQGQHAGSKADIGTGGAIRNTRKQLGS